ncbi:hypothetical protein [Treponema endosymbiont of Eucomonympha sp.]|uniref:hypothetical protein n=1 Tax=Treponema endosymbiont of Eucomonympha sp. TaxID=1580831 RepID=UPI00164F6C26|nr:hypothetical protein [Treponema endosymbiont of Eucomonympha sp.]
MNDLFQFLGTIPAKYLITHRVSLLDFTKKIQVPRFKHFLEKPAPDVKGLYRFAAQFSAPRRLTAYRQRFPVDRQRLAVYRQDLPICREFTFVSSFLKKLERCPAGNAERVVLLRAFWYRESC